MKDETPTKKTPWSEHDWFKNCVAILPFARWGFLLFLAVGGYYVYQRDVNAAQLVNVSDLKRDLDDTKKAVERNRIEREKDVDQIRRDMLTRELFEAKSAVFIQRLDQIDKKLEALADRP